MEDKNFNLESGFDWWLQQRGLVKSEIPEQTLKEMKKMFAGGAIYTICFQLDSPTLVNVINMFHHAYKWLESDMNNELFENLKKQEDDRTTETGG